MHASTYIGEFEAATAQEALKIAQDSGPYVSVCHQCAQDISDPEVVSITVENQKDDGEWETLSDSDDT